MELFKWSGAGNCFVVIDGRQGGVDMYRQKETVIKLCSEHETDGLMILSDSEKYDFEMEFYNPDGSSGMMCGNGGRCIVAFADHLGIKPDGSYRFKAPDGLHDAKIVSKENGICTVRLGMIDVQRIDRMDEPCGWLLNTGARHFVVFVDDTESIDIQTQGAALRYHEALAPEGANANFVQVLPDGSLRVRTYERGVERETLACGTGLTASAIAAVASAETSSKNGGVTVHARQNGLSVEFEYDSRTNSAHNVFLIGPAELLSTIGHTGA